MGRPRKWKSDAERKRAERAGSSEPLPVAEEIPDRGALEDVPVPVVQTEALELALKRSRDAEALGRRYGEDTADRLGETGPKREGRIARAIAYQRFLLDSVLHE